MKKLLTIFIFLILPALLFIISFTSKESEGPYFTSHQYDPNYAYLISSLNLAQLSGYGVAHVDHPGTTLQVIGAVVIKISCYFGGHEDLAKEVLLNPEKYLAEIDYTLVIINCIGIFLLGMVSYRVYSNVAISLLMQLAPFTSFNIILWFSLVGPENFLVFVSSIFLAALILFLNEPDINTRKYLKYFVVLAIICGLGIATKLTFFPLAIIPLILIRGFKWKLIFLLIIGLSFLFFVIPAISSGNITVFTNWVYNIFIHTRKYGSGEPNIIDPRSFLHNIKTIILLEWIFVLAYFSIFLSLLMCLLPKFKNRFIKNINFKLTKSENGFVDNNKFRLALGIFLTMSLQILIVAKHYKANYMFPSLIICSFAIFTSVSILSESFGKKFTDSKKNAVYFIMVFLITVYAILTSYRFGNNLELRKIEAIKFINYTEENYANSIKVFYSYPFSGREFGLMFGVSYAGPAKKSYDAVLNSEYPNSYFYYKKFTSFSDDTTKIANSFKSADKIMLYCWEDTQPETFIEILKKDFGIINATTEKKFSNENRELVYEIKLEH